MARSSHRLRAGVETAATRAALALLPRLSRAAVLRLARWLGRAAYRLSGQLRRTGLANLDLAFGDTLPPEEKRRILRASLENFARVALDVFWFARRTGERLDRYVSYDETVTPDTLHDRAQVFVTGHLGNWEVIGQAFARRGYPLASVAAPLANPVVDRLLIKLRTQSGQEVIPKEGALLRLVRRLRGGGKVALLLDQNTKPADGGVFVEFFGRAVPVSQAAAALAMRTRSELCYTYCLPVPDGSYRAHVAQRLSPDEYPPRPTADDVRAMTQRLTGLAEEAVRAHPEHWLWTYKRWKHVPPGGDRSAYPFYAKAAPEQDPDAP